MKNLFLTFLCFGLLLTSCTDETVIVEEIVEEVDPIVGSTFEIDNVDFISNDNLIAVENVIIPDDIEVFQSDVPLVFVLDPIASANNGVDVFEPLPRVFFFDNNGFAQFRFNFIFDDASGIFDLDLILESDDFSSLGTDFTDDQIFRIVIVPSDFAEANPDISFEELQSELNF